MQIHIIGGGIAGLSAAYALAGTPVSRPREIHLWEKEKLACMHSSSRNAAIFRTYESDPVLSLLVKDSYRELQQIETVTGALLDRRGLLIDPLELDYYEDNYCAAHPGCDGIRSSARRFGLPGGSNISGYFLRDNGVLDIHSLQDYYIRKINEKGVRIHYQSEVSGIDLDRSPEGGRIRSFRCRGEDVKITEESIVINAAGSWAVELFAQSGYALPPIAPYKRHLFFIKTSRADAGGVALDAMSAPLSELRHASWPVLWNEKRDVYLRPESNGFLATHCDQRETFAGDYTPDDREIEKFLKSVLSVFPFLRDHHISRYWACLRTFSLDQHPVVGFDPFVKNLFWVAGLGGRGMTIAPGLAPLIRHLVEAGQNFIKNPYSPIRFS